MMSFYHQFYLGLPVRQVASDRQLHSLDEMGLQRVRISRRNLTMSAALLLVIFFLSDCLPIYFYPQLLPVADLSIPILGTIYFHWAGILWLIFLENRAKDVCPFVSYQFLLTRHLPEIFNIILGSILNGHVSLGVHRKIGRLDYINILKEGFTDKRCNFCMPYSAGLDYWIAPYIQAVVESKTR
jgi:hypothetical protein